MTHKERFQKLGVRPPKGVLLYGPPGTGKTLMARACAAQTNATFLKLAGPQLVQVWPSISIFTFLYLLYNIFVFNISTSVTIGLVSASMHKNQHKRLAIAL